MSEGRRIGRQRHMHDRGELPNFPIRSWIEKHPLVTGVVVAAGVLVTMTAAGIANPPTFIPQLMLAMPGELASMLVLSRMPRAHMRRLAVGTAVAAMAGFVLAAVLPGGAAVVAGCAGGFAAGMALPAGLALAV